jgi:hypothetical protein
MTDYTSKEIIEGLRAGKLFKDDDTVLISGSNFGAACSFKNWLALRALGELQKVQRPGESEQ